MPLIPNSDEIMKTHKTGALQRFFPHDQTKNRVKLASVLILALLLGACASGTSPSGSQARTTGAVLDDQTVEYKVVDHIYSAEEFTNQDHIKVEVRNAVVLLVGETQSESNKLLAEQRTAELNYVERVVNELAVAAPDSVGGRFENAWLTTKVNTALTTKNPIRGFDATRIKVVTANNTVYLMGQVTREEGDAVAEVARNVGGVEKVVKVFSYPQP
jgi:osmotically-inducible protein OsmY